MNPEIDFNNLGVGVKTSPHSSLIGPPRRIFTRYVLPIVILVSFAGLGAVAFRDSFQSRLPVAVTLPIPISTAGLKSTATSVKAPAPETKSTLFQAPGWIEPEPYPIKISALRMGNVESIDVLEGESVTLGAVIARLVEDDAVLAVESAKSMLSLKRAQLEAAQNRWANPTDQVEAIETAKATSERLQAEARRLQEILELAKVEADVGTALSKGGYEASLETLRKKTQLSASRNQLAETQAQIRENSATLRAASERLSLRIDDRHAVESAKAEVAAAEAALATAQLQLDRSVIQAPSNGTIMRLYAAPGSMLSSDMVDGMLIATLYQPDHMQIRVDVPLAEAAKVRPGLNAQIKVEALPDRTFDGELINIVPEFDLQKNTLPVKVRINNPDQALRPEMIARVEFFQSRETVSKPVQTADTKTTDSASIDVISSAFLVPATSVLTVGENSKVFVVGPDERAHSREVVLAGTESGGYVTVMDGVRVTDKIIDSPGAITENALVKVEKVITDVAN